MQEGSSSSPPPKMSASSSTKEHHDFITKEVQTEAESLENDIRVVDKKHMDTTLQFMEEHGDEYDDPTPAESKHLFNKAMRKVLGMVFVINLLMFMDKNAIGYAKYLDMPLTSSEISNVNTLFYAGYMIGQFPGHFLFQRYNTRWVMSITLLCWTILMFSQIAEGQYKATAPIRFFLGLTEASVTPCIEHTLSKFFTPEEQAYINPIFWIGTVGVGIPTGFMSYGIAHITSYAPWKVYWLVNGGLTVLVNIWVAFAYPDNPATFKGFTVKERVQTIKRIKKESRSSIDEKKIKPYQVKEAFSDPLTYLFGLLAFTQMLANNMNFVQQTITLSLKVSKINGSLITVAQGAYSTVLFLIGSWMMKRWKNSLCYIAVLFNMPAILGGLLAVLLPWSNKVGILAACIIVHTDGFAYIVSLVWSQTSAAGYTKRLIRTAMFMIGYGVANMVAPQIWKIGKPRYYQAWSVQIVVAWFGSSLLMLSIRYILSKRNKERLANLEHDSDGNVIIKEATYVDDKSSPESGTKKTDISNFDLTDRENKQFIYPL